MDNQVSKEELFLGVHNWFARELDKLVYDVLWDDVFNYCDEAGTLHTMISKENDLEELERISNTETKDLTDEQRKIIDKWDTMTARQEYAEYLTQQAQRIESQASKPDGVTYAMSYKDFLHMQAEDRVCEEFHHGLDEEFDKALVAFMER